MGAYAKVTPHLATRTIPVAETTHIHTPAAIKTVQPAAIVTTKHVAQPILKQEQLYRNEPAIGPAAAIRYEAAPVVAAGLEAAAIPAVTPFALGAGIAHPFAHGAALAHGLPLAAEIAPAAVVAE